MSWKSIAILPPQRGVGFDSKILRERSRKSRIHAGSCFISEIAETICGFRPRSALNTACEGVMKSYLLISPTPVSSGADIKSVAMVYVLFLVPTLCVGTQYPAALRQC